MATFKKLETSDKKQDLWLLSDIHLGYVFMSKAKMNDNKGVECYSTALFVDEDTLDLIDETLGKDIKRKKTKTAEFKEKHHFDAPYPDEKHQYNINLNNPANDAKGNPYELWQDMRSNVYQVVVGEDGKKTAKDITLEGNVGNGSKGNVVLSRFTNKYGSFLSLRKIYVTDLIEYESTGSRDVVADAMGFDAVETYSDEELKAKAVKMGQSTAEDKQAQNDLAKASPAPEMDLPDDIPDMSDDGFDDSIPF